MKTLLQLVTVVFEYLDKNISEVVDSIYLNSRVNHGK